jgi:hypothetical protein
MPANLVSDPFNKRSVPRNGFCGNNGSFNRRSRSPRRWLVIRTHIHLVSVLHEAFPPIDPGGLARQATVSCCVVSFSFGRDRLAGASGPPHPAGVAFQTNRSLIDADFIASHLFG